MVVPGGCAAGIGAPIDPASTLTLAPRSASTWRDTISKRDTEAIEGNASPRNPSVVIAARSSALEILLVACRDRASASSASGIPLPSSRTRVSRTPPASISTSMLCAPASRLFSTSSLTMDAGRSMTSPAAIWSMRWLSRMRMGMGRAVYRPPCPAGLLPAQGCYRNSTCAPAPALRRDAARRVPSGALP